MEHNGRIVCNCGSCRRIWLTVRYDPNETISRTVQHEKMWSCHRMQVVQAPHNPFSLADIGFNQLMLLQVDEVVPLVWRVLCAEQLNSATRSSQQDHDNMVLLGRQQLAHQAQSWGTGDGGRGTLEQGFRWSVRVQ